MCGHDSKGLEFPCGWTHYLRINVKKEFYASFFFLFFFRPSQLQTNLWKVCHLLVLSHLVWLMHSVYYRWLITSVTRVFVSYYFPPGAIWYQSCSFSQKSTWIRCRRRGACHSQTSTSTEPHCLAFWLNSLCKACWEVALFIFFFFVAATKVVQFGVIAGGCVYSPMCTPIMIHPPLGCLAIVVNYLPSQARILLLS